MNSHTLSGKWNEVKGLLMQKYGQLSKDELARAQGDVNRLIGIFQQKTGQARDDIERFLNNSLGDASGMAGMLSETASQYAADAADYARQGYKSLEHAAQDGFRVTRDYVKRSPAESVAVAFGIGAMAGVLAALVLQSPRR